MSDLQEHPAAVADDHARLAEETRLRRSRAARVRRSKIWISATVICVMAAAWVVQLVTTDAYRARVTRDEIGVYWVLDQVSIDGVTAQVPPSHRYWLELGADGQAATSSIDRCSVDSSTWSATREGFTFFGGDDEAIACPVEVPGPDPLIVGAQQVLLSGTTVRTKTDGTRLVLTSGSIEWTYHRGIR